MTFSKFILIGLAVFLMSSIQSNAQSDAGLSWVNKGHEIPANPVVFASGNYLRHPTGDLGSVNATVFVIRAKIADKYHLGFTIDARNGGGGYGEGESVPRNRNAARTPPRDGYVMVGEVLTKVTSYQFLAGPKTKWKWEDFAGRSETYHRGLTNNTFREPAERGSSVALALIPSFNRQQPKVEIGFVKTTVTGPQSMKRELYITDAIAWVLGRNEASRKLKLRASDSVGVPDQGKKIEGVAFETLILK